MNKRLFSLLWLLAGCVLLGVFMLYRQPVFAQSMADQLWMCF
jgi:hypothetical protein